MPSSYLSFILYQNDFLLHLGIDIIIIFLCYVAIPISVLKKTSITFTFTTLNLLMLFYYKEDTYQITYTGYTLSIITANLLGYLISVQQGRLKRTNYLHLIKERKALEDIRTLRGVIPICSYCRNIRDDRGSWKELESYIDEHLDTQFSHGISPKCIADAKSSSGLDSSNN